MTFFDPRFLACLAVLPLGLIYLAVRNAIERRHVREVVAPILASMREAAPPVAVATPAPHAARAAAPVAAPVGAPIAAPIAATVAAPAAFAPPTPAIVVKPAPVAVHRSPIVPRRSVAAAPVTSKVRSARAASPQLAEQAWQPEPLQTVPASSQRIPSRPAPIGPTAPVAALREVVRQAKPPAAPARRPRVSDRTDEFEAARTVVARPGERLAAGTSPSTPRPRPIASPADFDEHTTIDPPHGTADTFEWAFDSAFDDLTRQ